MCVFTWIWHTWCVWIAYLFCDGILVWNYTYFNHIVIEIWYIPIMTILLIICSIYILKEESKYDKKKE